MPENDFSSQGSQQCVEFSRTLASTPPSFGAPQLLAHAMVVVVVVAVVVVAVVVVVVVVVAVVVVVEVVLVVVGRAATRPHDNCCNLV